MKNPSPVASAFCCCIFASAAGAHELGPTQLTCDTNCLPLQIKKPQLLAGGPVMRPSSANQPMTNPSTGPRTYSSKPFTALPVAQPTELQEKTAPTKATVQQDKTLQEKETKEQNERQRKAMSTSSQ